MEEVLCQPMPPILSCTPLFLVRYRWTIHPSRGVLGYNEICELHSDWTYVWDDEQKVPHRISGDQWVGYEDTNSIQLKAAYAMSKNLGGMMLWALDTDDFLGICGSEVTHFCVQYIKFLTHCNLYFKISCFV
ncbi:hypothetical protein NQ317_013351 [Molorchus minor]|uniref:GH18 domain-containing protein n=1 Tax=Molorchus minor TaxID=1323400 RepID=A0ABQ9IUT0_9CUCU|nr:hypothetical protein NQ317_013351 [Molorchus minor]